MAHRLHRGLAPAEVLRGAEAGERLQRALQSVCEADDGGAAALRAMLTDGGEITPDARAAAFDALVAMGSAISVAALLELTALGACGLDISGATRRLPLAALMRHCGLGEASPAQLAAFEEADLGSVGDLVRYCADGADGADVGGHVMALELELGGAVGRQGLRALVAEARALCAATSRLLPPAGAAAGAGHQWNGLGGGGSAALRAWEEPAEAVEPQTRDVGC